MLNTKYTGRELKLTLWKRN